MQQSMDRLPITRIPDADWVRKLQFSDASGFDPKAGRCNRSEGSNYRATDYENLAGTCQVMKVVYFI